jgi:ABC-2 type transport system permease protein
MSFNPLVAIFDLYRAAFFPSELNWYAVLVGTLVTLVLLAIGILVFKRTERAVLKEI